MIIAIVIILALIATIGFFAWQYQIEQSAVLAAQVHLAQIQAQARLDYLDHLWPFFLVLSGVAIVLVGIVAYTIIATKRPGSVVNDHRTIYLMLPDGQSRRQYLKSLGAYNVLPLPPGARIERLENRDVKLLGRGER